MKETVKQRTVIQEKPAELFVNGKNTVPVGDTDQFEGHGSGTLHGVEISAGRAETAVTAERDKFEFSAVRTAIHGAAKSGVAAVNHFFNIFDDRVTRM